MRSTIHDRRSGSVLIMVTLSLFVMMGMLGLAVDLGWAHFVKKSAQLAADAGALAAVKIAKDNAVNLADYDCDGGGFVDPCASVPIDCPNVPASLTSACLYPSMHGFAPGPRRKILVQAWDQSGPPTVIDTCGQGGATVHHPPTAGCVETYYWVSVSVAETIPQLFSAIYGNTQGTVAAKATAAVAQSQFIGSLILLNRQNEQWTPPGSAGDTGNDLYASGSGTVSVPGGIILSSTAHGPAVNQDPWAGFISGSGTVDGPTYIRQSGSDAGWYAVSGGGQWTGGVQNQSAQEMFVDPMGGKGQPPIKAAGAQVAVPGGTLTSALCGGGDCPSGYYYATDANNVATGNPIVITSDVTFRGGAFGEFHFFGGLEVKGAAATFGPGRYVLAGVLNPTTELLKTENQARLLSTASDDAGRVFILTDTQYGGPGSPQATILQSEINSIANKQWASLSFSKSSIKAGNNANSRIDLYGLNKSALSDLGEVDLEPFAPSVIWQDQRNSYVKYTSEGNIDTSCAGATLDNPCAGAVTPDNDSPQLEMWATPFSNIIGLVYQPRGAWMVMQASGDYTGPLRIVSGALYTGGTGNLVLTGEAPPILTYITALVE